MKKGEKKKHKAMLRNQGMLPSDSFNYKSVDFGSFQGGSTAPTTSKITPLAQNKVKINKTISVGNLIFIYFLIFIFFQKNFKRGNKWKGKKKGKISGI